MLKFFGASAAVVALGTACTKEGITSIYSPGNNLPPAPPVDNSVQLGVGDVQILNFAYALEQLEAAFYVQVVSASNFSSVFTNADERLFLSDIRDHEVAHREFFKLALGSARIKDLTPNFAAVDFNSRTSILATAKAFEDTGVSAYNGAAQYLSDLNYLLAAGKIVSVEARHAAIIRDLILPGTFADDLDSDAKDIEKTPKAVVDIANSFLAAGSQISKNGLPA